MEVTTTLEVQSSHYLGYFSQRIVHLLALIDLAKKLKKIVISSLLFTLRSFSSSVRSITRPKEKHSSVYARIKASLMSINSQFSSNCSIAWSYRFLSRLCMDVCVCIGQSLLLADSTSLLHITNYDIFAHVIL